MIMDVVKEEITKITMILLLCIFALETTVNSQKLDGISCNPLHMQIHTI